MNKVFCLSVICFCFIVHTVSAQETKKEPPSPSRLLSTQSKLVFDANETEELIFLKQKVETYRRLFNYVDEAYRTGSSGGTASHRAEVKAELSAAEAEMFRYEGNRTQWLESLETQEEARTEQLRNVAAAFNIGGISFEALCQAELKLLNAQLELKRAMNIFKRPWGPEQVIGKPDTLKGGDNSTAWASLTRDGQKEWLELIWKTPVEAVSIDVYETYNPGALEKVTTFDKQANEITLWEGVDPIAVDTADGKGISQIHFEKPVEISKVRLYLDSPKVPGWNEIDAAGLIDSASTVHWVTGATASSTYADRTSSRHRILQTEEEEKVERTWAAPEKEEQVREVLRKMKEANTYWFSGSPKKDVELCEYVFHLKENPDININKAEIEAAQSWYQEFYRKGISFIGASRLLLVDINGLHCTSVEEDTQAQTITFGFVLSKAWMNAFGNGIAGSWRGWHNGPFEEGTAVISTKTWTPIQICSAKYTETYSDYTEIKPGQFVPLRIVIDYHDGKPAEPLMMYFDFRFKIYEPGIWLFDKSLPQDEKDNSPIAWIDNVQIECKPAKVRK